jgi:NAD(P) transhydrogenase
LHSDGRQVVREDELLQRERLPRQAFVVGGGKTGLRAALFLARMGVAATVIDGRLDLLDAPAAEVAGLISHAVQAGVHFTLGQDVIAAQRTASNRIGLTLESGVRLAGECAVLATGRQGNTEPLNLLAAGLRADERGRIWCNAQHQTWTPHIYAVGDVVGFPTLSRAGEDSGRRAAQHACGHTLDAPRLALAN